MSSDPSPHLPAPVAPPGAAEVDPQSQPAEPPAEPPEVMHRTRAVDFLGRRTPIVYQNDNGPCPLLAICELPFDSEPPLRVHRACQVLFQWYLCLLFSFVQVTCCC